MKKLVLGFSMLFFATMAFSQYEYGEMVLVKHPLKRKTILMAFDIGEHKHNSPENVIKDETGKNINFNSEMDGLNYMAQYGWELVESNQRPDRGGAANRYYILRRKIE